MRARRKCWASLCEWCAQAKEVTFKCLALFLIRNSRKKRRNFPIFLFFYFLKDVLLWYRKIRPHLLRDSLNCWLFSEGGVSGGSNEESVPVSGVRGGVGEGTERRRKKKKVWESKFELFLNKQRKKKKRGKRKIANTPPGNPFLSLK